MAGAAARRRADPDIVVASAKAYVNAVNRPQSPVERLDPQASTPQEVAPAHRGSPAASYCGNIHLPCSPCGEQGNFHRCDASAWLVEPASKGSSPRLAW